MTCLERIFKSLKYGFANISIKPTFIYCTAQVKLSIHLFKLGHEQMLEHSNVHSFVYHSSVEFLLPNIG